jgi:hypothetical protein
VILACSGLLRARQCSSELSLVKKRHKAAWNGDDGANVVFD